jgi:hypothetical protein
MYTETIYDWRFIQLIQEKKKDPIPYWYKLLKEKITIPTKENLKTIWKNFSWLLFEPLIFKKLAPMDRRKKEWYCGLTEEGKIIWGKTHNKSLSDITNRINLSHYKSKQDFLINNTILTPCPRCSLHKEDSNTTIACNVSIKKKNIISCQFLNNRKILQKNKNELMIPCNLYTLENLAKDKFSSYETTPNDIFQAIEIANWRTEIINKHISSQEHKDELNKVLIQNLSKETSEPIYEFYTDGSLIDRGTETMKMGAAWLQTSGPNPGSLFFTEVSDWPSSFRAETTAILTAILTVTPNSKVTIYTDSQNCIDTYNKLTNPDPK